MKSIVDSIVGGLTALAGIALISSFLSTDTTISTKTLTANILFCFGAIYTGSTMLWKNICHD